MAAASWAGWAIWRQLWGGQVAQLSCLQNLEAMEIPSGNLT